MQDAPSDALPRRAAITGASGGIGAAFAVALARRRFDLLLVARNEARLAALAQRLRNERGAEVDVVVADLTDGAQLRTVEARLAADADSSCW